METQVTPWDAAGAERAVAVLKAVADPTRYRLLWTLSQRELPVSTLANMLGAHVAATSQHLARLRAAGLVTSRREGTRIFYRAAGAHVRGLLEEASLVVDEAERAADSEGSQAATVATAQEQPARVRPMPARLRPVAGR
ncbi:ArsR/SmtB family transcription factor [Streptomyces sp. NPDC018000]|uniref:ArsR/SmtB family transcription factor n=1 Tax=Streptomyces sp. NPDC018000 TaxID=3365028 RepID=UPI00379B8E28